MADFTRARELRRLGVFILRDGKWELWATGAESFVRQERAYLSDMLGLRAEVFRRAA